MWPIPATLERTHCPNYRHHTWELWCARAVMQTRGRHQYDRQGRIRVLFSWLRKHSDPYPLPLSSTFCSHFVTPILYSSLPSLTPCPCPLPLPLHPVCLHSAVSRPFELPLKQIACGPSAPWSMQALTSTLQTRWAITQILFVTNPPIAPATGNSNKFFIFIV